GVDFSSGRDDITNVTTGGHGLLREDRGAVGRRGAGGWTRKARRGRRPAQRCRTGWGCGACRVRIAERRQDAPALDRTCARRTRSGHPWRGRTAILPAVVTVSSASDIHDAALAWPEAERLDLASRLLVSIEGPPDDDWYEAWLAEL